MNRTDHQKRRKAIEIGKARSLGRTAAREGKEYRDCPFDDMVLRSWWRYAFEAELVNMAQSGKAKEHQSVA